MNKLLVNQLIVILSVFVLLFIYGKFGPQIPLSVVSKETGQPMTIEGEGKVTAIPDIVSLSFGIEETGANLKEVQNSVDSKTSKVIRSLKELSIEEKDIKTTSYNIRPEYDYESSPQRITGYKVDTGYEVKIKEFDKVNDAIALVTQSGVNNIGNISFQLSEDKEKEVLGQARKKAVDEAKIKAESLAMASGVTLGKIININENPRVDSPFYAVRDSAQKLNVTNESKLEIAPGETEISVTVSISWEIR